MKKLPDLSDPFRGLSPEEYDRVEPLPEEVILEACERGYEVRRACLDEFVLPALPSGLRFT
jgi:hypothetical protein